MNEAAYEAMLSRLGLEPASSTAPVSPDWLSAWREVVVLVRGIREDDRRFPFISAALSRLDDAFVMGDFPLFQRMTEGLRRVVAPDDSR